MLLCLLVVVVAITMSVLTCVGWIAVAPLLAWGSTAFAVQALAGRARLGTLFVDRFDLLLVYPASANTITRLRAGLADDLAGCLFLANNFHKPWWIAPAMNSEMFAHPAVAGALAELTRRIVSEEARPALTEPLSGKAVITISTASWMTTALWVFCTERAKVS